ncbi:polysaccharide deacetylase family protein [Phaeacidiphilus oryzae]|uniref:polysaccharide deacetylase family protein n=1 Tax=Phaeacidiphilus oryzae TaxID=348818 RepID=UPI0005603A2D
MLLYHAVMDDPPSWIARYTVRPKDFAAQLDAIADSGHTAITASRLVRGLAEPGSAGLPENPIVITIDDGFADLPAFTAPAMAERGLTGTAYLTTGALDGSRDRAQLLPPAPMMTLGQVGDLTDCGLEVGAHTITHPQLDTLGSGAVARELAEPKKVLEDVLGEEVPAFAYPHGYSSRRVRRQVAAAGYTSAVAVRNALSSAEDEPYRISRLMLNCEHTLDDLTAWLDGRAAPVAPFPDRPRTVAWRAYRRLRTAVKGPAFAG